MFSLDNFIKLCVGVDNDGIWFGYCPSLPGIVAQGNDREDTFNELKDAFRSSLEIYQSKQYLDEFGQIPWDDTNDFEKFIQEECDCKEKIDYYVLKREYGL